MYNFTLLLNFTNIYFFWQEMENNIGVLFLLLITNHLPEKEIIIASIFICPIIVVLVNFIAFKLKIKRGF